MSSRQDLRSACDKLADLVPLFKVPGYSNLQICVFHQAYAALHSAEYNATMGTFDVTTLYQIIEQLDYLKVTLQRQTVVAHHVSVNTHFETIGEALDRSPTPVDPNLYNVSEEL
jgi:hypothetical protein